jgi:osmotically-inducible protein OsmY
MYDVDLRDPQLYDLVINIEKMSIPTACAMIVEAAKKQEFVVTESVRASLADFSVECRVRVALATQPASRGLDLDVSVKNGVVFMSGEVPRAIMLAHTSSRWERDLTQIAESVAGVVRAELSIGTFDAYH